MRRLIRIVLWLVLGVGVIAVGVLGAWSVAIGPVAVWRILTHGTTTVWDHLEYPGRSFEASRTPDPWEPASSPLIAPVVDVDGVSVELETLLEGTGSLAFVVVRDGNTAYEWYAADHGPDRTSMVFSVSKSVLSLLIGAVDDGIIASVGDSVTTYVPELGAAGLDGTTIEDLLHMDSNLDYVEDDNPFGIHVEFNYTDDLTGAILGLTRRGEADSQFRYKSGDNALLGLILTRALGDSSITEYFHRRLWDPIGSEHGGVWSTDRDGGLERTWCCLAVTAPDLARLGRLVLQDGAWSGTQLLSAAWLRASFEPGYPPARWPAEYEGAPLANYGYQWWLTSRGARVALGKDGQYLFVDPVRDVVIVRLGESQGGVSWLDVVSQVAETSS